jgi:hypothetical protein
MNEFDVEYFVYAWDHENAGLQIYRDLGALKKRLLPNENGDCFYGNKIEIITDAPSKDARPERGTTWLLIVEGKITAPKPVTVITDYEF